MIRVFVLRRQGVVMIEFLKAFAAGLILSGLALWLMKLTGQF